MNDSDFTLPPGLNEALSSFHAAQNPDPLFAGSLEKQLLQRQTELVEATSHQHFSFGDSMKKIKLTFRTRPVLAILTALLALMILTCIVYAVAQLAGFIPGIGFVNDVQSVMATPVSEENPLVSSTTAEQGESENAAATDLTSQTRDGITFTVEQAVADADQLVIVYKITGLPANYFGPEHNPPSSSEEQEDFIPDRVRLPDNSILDYLDGSICSGAGDLTTTWLSCRYMFSPLPQGITEFTLEIHRLYNALPNELPEDWQIPIHMGPVTASAGVNGVQEMDLRSQTIHGLTLQLLKVSQGATQTAFQLGMLSDLPDQNVWYMAPVTLQDARGRYYIISSGPDGGHYVGDSPNAFIFQSMYTTPVDSSGPLTFNIDWEMIAVNPAAKLNFDPGKNAKIGQEWVMDERFTVGEINLHFTKARLMHGSEGDVVLEFDIEAPAEVTEVALFPENLTSSSSSSGYNIKRGLIVSRISLPAIPVQPVELRFSQILYKVTGPWRITWQPEQIDFSAAPTPTPVPTRLADATPTLVPDQPLLLELQELLAKASLTTPTGPGWVHQVTQNDSPITSEDVQLDYLPERLQYSLSDNWYFLDNNGYILTGIYINKKMDGSFSSATINNGIYYFNIPQMDGGQGDSIYLEKPTFYGDALSSMNRYVSQGGTIRREESMVDGVPCLLYEATWPFNPPQVFVNEAFPVVEMVTSACINPVDGKILQSQGWSVYDNGQLSEKSKSQILLLEKVDVLPDDVQQLLDSVIIPQ